MKAFILAAGHGTRLRPLTDTLPKCLVPIRGVPMLQIWLEMCRLHGISQVLVNLHAHPQQVRDFVSTKDLGVSVTVSEETRLLGSAGTLLANREWIGKDESFWVLYGDVLTNTNLSEMVSFHRSRDQLATIGVYEVSDPSRCGIVSHDDNGIVQKFVEKPSNPTSNLAFAGLMVARRGILDRIPLETPVDIGFHVLPALVGQMAAYRISEYLVDVGTMENYRSAQDNWPGIHERDCARC